jgi:hypothetical protein
MKIPAFLLCFPALLLLAPLTRWLIHRHDLDFFLGLSSSFWAGVSMGVSIVSGAALIAIMVLRLAARPASGDRP